MALQNLTTKPFRKLATHLNKIVALNIPAALLLVSAANTHAEVNTVDNPSILPSFEIKPFTARYDAYAKGKKLGSAHRKLIQDSEFEFTFQFNSKLRFLFFSDKRNESVNFRSIDDNIFPLTYQYTRSGTGSEKSLTLTFDHTKQQLMSSEAGLLPLENQFDPQSYFIDFKRAMARGEKIASYNIINQKGQAKNYTLQVHNLETLLLPFGELEALKVEVRSSNKNKTTYAWFCPALQFSLVKMLQLKQGKEQGRIELSEYRTQSKTTD